MHNYKIVIPSYNREKTIQQKTLATLKKYNIPASKIDIFVADSSQYEIYRNALGAEYNIIIGVKGLAEVRNFILDYYPKDTKLVSMDDDIEGFLMKSDTGRIAQLPSDSLEQIIQIGFTKAEEHKTILWGLYPVNNNLFMKQNISSDLKFIIGSCFGIINPTATKEKGNIELPIKEKHDYILSLIVWERYNSVIRINYVSAKSQCYKEPGGLQSNPGRLEREKEVVEYIMNKWPQLVRINTRRKSLYPEILLKRRTVKNTEE